MPTSQKATASLLLLGGIALAFFGQQTAQDLPPTQRALSMAWIALGLLAFTLGVIAARQKNRPAWLMTRLQKSGAWLQIQPWQVAGLVFSLFFVALVHDAAGEAERMLHPVTAWLLWLVAIALVIAAGWRRGPIKIERQTAIYLPALVLIAFLVRAIATEKIPIILFGDEASAGIYAALFVAGKVNNPFIAGWYSFPGLYFLLPAAGITLFGQTIQALRIPSALAGALTVGGTYLAGRALFGRRVGLLAAILLLGLHFHIHFSRIGLNNIWDGLFYVLVIAAVWAGWKNEDRNALILGGVGLGLSQYFYPSSRSLLILVYGWLIIASLLDRRRFKKLRPDLVLMTLTGIVVFLPLGWYYARHLDQFVAPMQRVSILGEWMNNAVKLTGQPEWRIILNQLWLGVEGFSYLALQHWYRPGVPLLRPIMATLFYLGCILLVLNKDRSRTVLAALWLAIFILVGGLSESTPASQRYVAAAPICMLLVAFGVSETAAILEKFWPRISKPIPLLTLLIAAAIAFDDSYFYFNRYTPNSVLDLSQSNSMVAQHLADYLKPSRPDTEVVFFGQPAMGYYSIPTIQYLVPGVPGVDINSWNSPDRPALDAKHLVFVFLPANAVEIPAVQNDFPGGKLREEKTSGGNILYYFYEYSK